MPPVSVPAVPGAAEVEFMGHSVLGLPLNPAERCGMPPPRAGRGV
jgi:hypothetical protein